MHDWLRWTTITDFNHREAPDLPQRPCVIVANHPTLMDITSIIATLGIWFAAYAVMGGL